MTNSFEKIAGVLCTLSMVCAVIIAIGFVWLAVTAFMGGNILLGLLLTAGVGIILFLAVVLL